MGERLINQKFNVHNKDNEMNIVNPYRYASAGLTPLQESIVAAWDFENNMNDRVGGNDGTATNVVYSDGGYTVIDYCGIFVNAKVEIPDDNSLTFSALPFSISMWLHVGSDANQVIFAKRNTNTGDIEFIINYAAGDLYFRVYDSVSTNRIGQILEWNYTGKPSTSIKNYVFTFDGGTSTSGVKIYENGVLQTTTPTSSGTFTQVQNTAAKLWMGVNAEANNLYLLGRLDEVYIFNKELDATEAQFVYDEGAAGRTLI